jgi:indolepyruvate ferredoxin oxidoreductase alpha subunit
MTHIIAQGKAGERVLLLGNEAVARGALEANAEIVASYPGTPASEIVDTLALVADEVGMHVQWSTNEKVAFEVAIGGAICGKRSIASMKHIGANWVVDPLMHSTYHGFYAGLVLISADDPSGHSSANEQDNRYLAMMAEIPALEPSDVQEAKDYVGLAMEISEELRLPVMLRLVTRICHSRGDVLLGEMARVARQPKFKDDFYTDYVLGEGMVGPKVIPGMHAVLHQKLKRVEPIAKAKGLFRVEHGEPKAGEPRVGIVTASAPFNYVMDYVNKRKLRGQISILKLGLTNPFPASVVEEFLKGCERVMIVEEGEPFIERQVVALSSKENRSIQVFGKLTGDLPGTGELDYKSVDIALSGILGEAPQEIPASKAEIAEMASKILTPRILTMCAGCPHRGAYWAAKKAIRTVANARYLAVGDIGCYTLGMYPPLKFMQAVFGMGGSIGVANGVVKAGIEDPVIATIGDSTFYHAGVPALINATFNQANIKVMVLDNEVTAMTGYQPHPGCGETATRKPTKRVSIEELSRACGIEFVRVVDPYDIGASVKAMEDALKFNGPTVVIFRRMCSQEFLRIARRKGTRIAPCVVSEEKCVGCRTCVAAFGCPAIGFDKAKKKSFIDPLACTGCGVCIMVCPSGAIGAKEGN